MYFLGSKGKALKSEKITGIVESDWSVISARDERASKDTRVARDSKERVAPKCSVLTPQRVSSETRAHACILLARSSLAKITDNSNSKGAKMWLTILL